MTRNGAPRDAIMRRRENVGRLRLRGLSLREVATALAQMPEPIIVTYGTVNRDLKVLEAEWRANAARDIGVHIANQLAEIAEARRKCWQLEDMAGLARFIKLEADIRGTNAPQEVRLSWQRELEQYGVPADRSSSIFESLVETATAQLAPPAILDLEPEPVPVAIDNDVLVE